MYPKFKNMAKPLIRVLLITQMTGCIYEDNDHHWHWHHHHPAPAVVVVH